MVYMFSVITFIILYYRTKLAAQIAGHFLGPDINHSVLLSVFAGFVSVWVYNSTSSTVCLF